MLSLHPLFGVANSEGIPTHKRHMDDDDVDHFFKKRLLDNFENLKIFEGSKSLSPSPPIEASPIDRGISKDTVYIDSIDQFLKDNLDVSELKTTPVTSADEISRNTIKEIVVPKGFLKPLNDLFNEESKNKNQKFLNDKKKESIERIMSKKILQQRELLAKSDKQILEMDSMLDEGETYTEPEIEISNDELYYETYIMEYWSLIKYYNPPMLVLRIAQKWFLERKRSMFSYENNSELDLPSRIVYRSSQIEELDQDGDNLIESDSENANTPPCLSQFQNHFFHKRTSSPKIRHDYGDYYGEHGPKIYEVSDDEYASEIYLVDPDERADFENDVILDDNEENDPTNSNDNDDDEMELD